MRVHKIRNKFPIAQHWISKARCESVCQSLSLFLSLCMDKQTMSIDISEQCIDNCGSKATMQIGTKVMPRTRRCRRCLMVLPLACSYIRTRVQYWTWTARVRIRTRVRPHGPHTWRDRLYMRYTYDLPESALRSTSEYITAAFVALIPIADERMRVSGAPPGYFCAVCTSPKWSPRIGFSACDRCWRHTLSKIATSSEDIRGDLTLWCRISTVRRTPPAYKQSLSFTL